MSFGNVSSIQDTPNPFKSELQQKVQMRQLKKNPARWASFTRISDALVNARDKELRRANSFAHAAWFLPILVPMQMCHDEANSEADKYERINLLFRATMLANPEKCSYDSLGYAWYKINDKYPEWGQALASQNDAVPSLN